MILSTSTKILKEFLGFADGIGLHELRIHIEENKIWYKSIDGGNVAMVFAEMPNTLFNEFSFEPGIMCIDVTKFETVFGFGGDTIRIIRENNDSNVITIETNGYQSVQTLLNCGTLKAEPKSPEFDLPGIVEMAGKEFVSTLKNLKLTGNDKIRFVIKDGIFTLATAGDGQDKTERKFHSDEVLSLEGEGNSLYSFDYLIDMTRNWGGNVKINIGYDFPIIIDSQFAEGLGIAKFLLAPRIENND